MSPTVYHTFQQNPSLKKLKAESDLRQEAEEAILPLLPKALRGHVRIAHRDETSLTLVADPRHAAVYWLRYQEDIILESIKKVNNYEGLKSIIIRFSPQPDAIEAPQTSDHPAEKEAQKQRPSGLKTMWTSLHACVKDPELKKTFGDLSES